ncbi:hypothetical protein D3C76_1346630 [compost metagenome]
MPVQEIRTLGNVRTSLSIEKSYFASRAADLPKMSILTMPPARRAESRSSLTSEPWRSASGLHRSRTTSIATLPLPMTATCLPNGASVPVLERGISRVGKPFNAFKMAPAPYTRGDELGVTDSDRSCLRPVARTTTSKFSANASKLRSTPTLTLPANFTLSRSNSLSNCAATAFVPW